MTRGAQAYDAILVIDMQNSYLHPKGLTYAITGAPLVRIPETIEKNRQLVDAAHAAGVPVIYTRHCYRPGHIDAGWAALEKFHIDQVGASVDGTWDAELIEQLPVAPADHVLPKNRMDAFYGTSLAVLLSGLRAHRIGISGVVTNACVESTARAASMRDFDVTVFADCCTTLSEEDQNAALRSLERFGFASVVDLDAAEFGLAARAG